MGVRGAVVPYASRVAFSDGIGASGELFELRGIAKAGPVCVQHSLNLQHGDGMAL